METVFTGMQIIPGTPNQVMQKGCLIMEEGKITAVGPEGEVTIPQQAQFLDLSGKTLLPGLIDAHVHILLDASGDSMTQLTEESPVYSTVKGAKHLQKTLWAGITTVRDLGGQDYIELDLGRAIDEGLLMGPHLLGAGKVITMTGGHGHSMGREADGVDDVRQAAREQLKAGAQVIKVMATGGILTKGVEPGASELTQEEMQAAIEEAHKAGRKAASHAQGRAGIENAILAGIDSIEHGFFLDAELIALMLEKQIFLVPTLTAPYSILKHGKEAGIPEFVVKKTEKVYETHLESFSMALQSGVQIAMGTDAGTPFNCHGNNLQELVLMIQAGMDPLAAITSASYTAAQLLGILDERGTLEPGKAADLLVLGGDPLKDPGAFFRVEEVYKGGRPCKGVGTFK